MEMIENFATLTEAEQRAFAEALLKTLNSEKTFSADTEFKLVGVEADDTTGELLIDVEHTEAISVERSATWSCAEAEDATDDPGFEATYDENIYADAAAAFKAMTVEVDGYKVSLEIHDVDEVETIEVVPETVREEDAGIGEYEYWGHVEYDSRPYFEVEGTITKACECVLSLTVAPADNF